MIQPVVFAGMNELVVCACMIHLVFCSGMIQLKVCPSVKLNYIYSVPNYLLCQNGNIIECMEFVQL
jgi:hypothetical protein